MLFLLFKTSPKTAREIFWPLGSIEIVFSYETPQKNLKQRALRALFFGDDE